MVALDAGSRLDDTITILLGARLALPIVLSGTLLVLGLFAFLSWIARKATSYRPIGIEELAEEAERQKEYGGNDKSKKKKKKKEEEASVKTYPHKLGLLLPLNLLAFTYLADGAALIIDGVFLRKGDVDTFDLLLDLAALAAYSVVSFILIITRELDFTGHALFKVFAGASLIQAPVALGALAAVLAEVHLFDALHVFYLCTSSFRVICSVLLALAFRPKSHAKPDTSAVDERTPLLSAEAQANGQNGTAAKTEHGEAATEDDEDEEEDEEEKPKIRKYDVGAVVLRIRRLLPYVAPIRSTLVRVLLVVCIVLTLLQNATKILLPRQLGAIVQDLSEGRAPWTKYVTFLQKCVYQHQADTRYPASFSGSFSKSA